MPGRGGDPLHPAERPAGAWLAAAAVQSVTGLGEKTTLYRQAAYADPRETPEGTVPVSNDFAETLWFTPPVSDPENGVWWIDNKPHCAVAVEKLRTPPEPGTLTGEKSRGEKKINALMDMFPEGTMVCMTVVVQPQDRLEEQFNRLSKNAVGENTESGRVRRDVKTVKEYLGNRHKLYRAGSPSCCAATT